MRKLVLYTLMSLDGAVDHPGRYFMPRQEPGQAPELVGPAFGSAAAGCSRAPTKYVDSSC